MEAASEELPQFIGPIVQWPRYGALYREQQFIIAPVPTDDGRWLVSVNDWPESGSLYPTVIVAIDAALARIKDVVDRSTSDSASAPAEDPPAGSQ